MKFLLAVLLMIVPAALVLGQSQSEDFILTKSVIDAAGGRAASESFSVVAAAGQSTPIGLQTSETFRLNAGFLAPVLAVSPLSPIQELVILPEGTDVWLYWEPIPGAQSYVVYADTTALFAPSPLTFLGSTADTLFVHPGTISEAVTRRFYLVTTSTEPARFPASGQGIVRDQLIYRE